MLLTVRHLARSFGAVTVLADCSFIVNASDRIGIVGLNGVGKSTLLRILAGQDAADSGDFAFAPAVEFGYLPQATPDFAGSNIDDVMLAAVGNLRDEEARLHALEDAMATAQGPLLDEVLAEYGQVLAAFQARDGYALDARIDTVLAGLGIAHVPRERAVGTLSGGEKARVGLAALLLRAPDLLLLDEPTNHLDFAAMTWLEDYLATFHGAILTVSHDRQFLNRTVTQIFELDEHSHQMQRYVGDYDAYAAAKVAERRQWEAEYARQQDEIKELRKRIRESARQVAHNRKPKDGDKLIYNGKGENVQAAISRNVRAAEQQLAWIEADPIAKPPKMLRFAPHFRLEALRSDVVLAAEHLAKGYDGRAILRDVTLTLGAETRMLLVAPNGAGKTTLLRLLLGLETPDDGTVRRVASAQIGDLPQDPTFTDLTKTVLQTYGAHLVGQPEQFVAGLIGYGLFRLEDMSKTVRQLSLGQRRKLEIACMMAARPNVLLLDEPTNYLSLDVLEAFESAVLAFAGPVLAVSHDRWFIDRFKGEVWDLVAGRLQRRQ